MFSAYDLKKIIPRAIFALVAVNLSWGLMEIFIKGVEAIGNGAQELIMAPFGPNIGVQLGGTSNLAFSTIIAVAAGAALIGIIPVLGVAVSGLFGLLFAFGIIMLRKIMLIGLIIVAPVAIALSVFPQTESWAKKWWDWFSKLMLMYPFLMAMFGISEVAAGIISRTEGNEFEQLIYKLGAVIILIIPYFLVGKALTLAGGAIGKVAGMVNNKDRGIIDRTKKWEQGRVAERRSDARGGGRFDNGTLRGRVLNAPLRRAFNPGSINPLNSSSERRAALDAGLAASLKQHEELHPGAKELTGEEAEIVARSLGDRRVAQRAIATKAAQARQDTIDQLALTDPGMDAAQVALRADRAADRARQQWQDTLASAELKTGGLDKVAAAHAFAKATESGAFNADPRRPGSEMELERLGQELGQSIGGTGRAGLDMGNKLVSEGRKAAGEKGNLVMSFGGEGRTERDNVQRAVQRASTQQLGTQNETSGQQMARNLTQEIQDAQAAMQTELAAGNVAAAQGHLQTIITHRANLETVRTAAATHGNAQLQGAMGAAVNSAAAALQQAQADAVTHGMLVGTTIEEAATRESQRRTGITVQP